MSTTPPSFRRRGHGRLTARPGSTGSSARPRARERQLERYAADLREVFKQERSRAQELRRSYKATVLALANAVEARDAYTGSHAERVAAYGLRIAQRRGHRRRPADGVRLPAARRRQGRRPRRDPVQARPAHREERALIAAPSGDRLRDPAPRRLPRRGASRSCATTTSAGTARATRRGSRGEDIPVAARVFAVADTLDALTTDRPVPRGVPFAEARASSANSRARSSTRRSSRPTRPSPTTRSPASGSGSA